MASPVAGRDPSFSIIYGRLKGGKTADAIAAFPDGLYVAAPGALAPHDKLWGIPKPTAIDRETFADITALALAAPKGKYPALVVDDATLVADRTVMKLSQRLSGYDLWAAVLKQAIELRDTLRRLGMHVVFTAHEAVAEVKNGVRLPGGPSFPGQTRVKLPAAADLLLHAEERSSGLADDKFFGWVMMYRTSLTSDWLAGSRFHTADRIPMNLGEVLRSADFPIPRAKGLEWQEAMVEKLAGALVGADLSKPLIADQDHCRKVFDAARDGLSKHDPRHVEWTIRDGYDRAVLRVAQLAHRRRLY